MSRRNTLIGCAVALTAMVIAAPAASAVTYPQDYSAPDQAWNVLAPGEAGSNPPGANSFSQIPLYDGLTPNFDTVTDASLPVYFKKNVFGLGRRDAREHVQPARAPGRRHRARQQGRRPHHGDDARRHDVRRRLRQHPGPRAPDGAAARAVTAGGDRRSRHRSVPDPRLRAPVRALGADRGLPRGTGPAAAEPRPGRPADRRRHRRIRRRHQRRPQPRRRSDAAVDPQRRDRDRVAARRPVRPRWRRRGPSRTVPLGPERQAREAPRPRRLRRPARAERQGRAGHDRAEEVRARR